MTKIEKMTKAVQAAWFKVRRKNLSNTELSALLIQALEECLNDEGEVLKVVNIEILWVSLSSCRQVHFTLTDYSEFSVRLS